MTELTQEYCILFNSITRAELALEELRRSLMAAQQQAEEVFIRRTDT